MADFDKLSEPFPPSLVSWRVGSMNKDKNKGMALAYIDARDVMRRLDDVCGPAGWQARYPHANGKTICEIGIKVDGEWVWKANGAGDTDIEAEKGAISDAFKRAAVMWGVGRYLYDLPSPWVAVNQFKQIEDAEYRKLEALLVKNAPAAKPVAAPEPSNAAKVMIATIDSLETRDQVKDWIFANKAEADKLADGEAVIAHARQRYSDLPKEEIAA
jgi:hypothetical protein